VTIYALPANNLKKNITYLKVGLQMHNFIQINGKSSLPQDKWGHRHLQFEEQVPQQLQFSQLLPHPKE